ncbi:hypothetical protein LCGC14_3098120 [marine sediment metagenome]|uniref:Ubiquitin-like domain-containing protein n=1 Tax=marine sediment metagenome TaxID=412755 RepID=A0A0F8YYM2_9ZZZZ|nr:MAG: hypothetical protein HeimC3_53390 [Candidatus Heimdallarchaeota archaeon LC_3]
MPDKFKIIFIVNGNPTEIEVIETQVIQAAVVKALKSFNITFSKEWEAKADGNTLDLNKSFKDQGFTKPATITLTKGASTGGMFD